MGKSGLFDLTGQQPILVPKSDSYWILPEQFLGLEIEIEDYKSSQVAKLLRASGNWASVEDHSLRQGIELVFSQALMGQQLSEAINEFFDNVTSYSNGPRTSIHVHVNMRQEEDTPLSLRNLCVLYYMYEDAFFAIADENRKWCSYCNPFEDSPPEVLTAVIRGESMKDIRRQIELASDGRTNRYYGLNLLALGRHGTVEFRHMPCVKDRERVVEWIQLIMELKLAATTMAANGVGPFDVFTDVSLLASMSQYMPRFGNRLRDIVPDVVAYRKLGLASMYRSGEQRPNSNGIGGNATFVRYMEKAFGEEGVSSTKASKKRSLYEQIDALSNDAEVRIAPRRTTTRAEVGLPARWTTTNSGAFNPNITNPPEDPSDLQLTATSTRLLGNFSPGQIARVSRRIGAGENANTVITEVAMETVNEAPDDVREVIERIDNIPPTGF